MEKKATWSVKAIAAGLDINIETLAEKANINVQHLKDVSAGRVRMTADDLIKLSAVSGIAPNDIKIV